MTRELEEGPTAEINVDLFQTKLKTYQIGKCQAMMEYMVFSSRNSPPSRQSTTINFLQTAYMPG